MNNLWKGIALLAVWGGLAAVICVGLINKRPMELGGYGIGAVLATFFICMAN